MQGVDCQVALTGLAVQSRYLLCCMSVRLPRAPRQTPPDGPVYLCFRVSLRVPAYTRMCSHLLLCLCTCVYMCVCMICRLSVTSLPIASHAKEKETGIARESGPRKGSSAGVGGGWAPVCCASRPSCRPRTVAALAEGRRRLLQLGPRLHLMKKAARKACRPRARLPAPTQATARFVRTRVEGAAGSGRSWSGLSWREASGKALRRRWRICRWLT